MSDKALEIRPYFTMMKFSIGYIVYLSNLFESLRIHICKDVALRQRDYLEGHSTVVVLQRGDVIVTHCQLSAGIDLVSNGRWETWLDG